MKVYKIELLFIDFDGIGREEIKELLEGMRLPNSIIPPDVIKMKERDIGEWSDDSPLNYEETRTVEFERLFGP